MSLLRNGVCRVRVITLQHFAMEWLRSDFRITSRAERFLYGLNHILVKIIFAGWNHVWLIDASTVPLMGPVSDIMEIEYGIPQGSCLRPLLFIIYLNDFEQSPTLHSQRGCRWCRDNILKQPCSANSQTQFQSRKTEYRIIYHPRRRTKGESLSQLLINWENIKQVDKQNISG